MPWYLSFQILKLPQRLFLIPDAIGLALFTIAGTQIALQWHAPWLVASLLGVITGVVGGVLRFVPGGFTLIAAVVCALATAGMVVAVFSPIRTIPASADWERSEA